MMARPVRESGWHRSKRVITAEFKRNRVIVRNRDRGLCIYCELVEGRINPGAEVDHIDPVSSGGDDSLYNLQLLCKNHHMRKTQRESNGHSGFPSRVCPETGRNLIAPNFKDEVRQRTDEWLKRS